MFEEKSGEYYKHEQSAFDDAGAYEG